jgi:hypothetical protein
MTGWISGECADGECAECPGQSLFDDELGPCAHPCHAAPAGEDQQL